MWMIQWISSNFLGKAGMSPSTFIFCFLFSVQVFSSPGNCYVISYFLDVASGCYRASLWWQKGCCWTRGWLCQTLWAWLHLWDEEAASLRTADVCPPGDYAFLCPWQTLLTDHITLVQRAHKSPQNSSWHSTGVTVVPVDPQYPWGTGSRTPTYTWTCRCSHPPRKMERYLCTTYEHTPMYLNQL